MKKIEFSIENEYHAIFIEDNHFKKITNLAGGKEQGGYIFISKIKNTQEYIVELLTDPHKRDICSETFIKLSNKHKRIARKIQRKNNTLYEVGFYHTHPESFGCRQSEYDLEYFSNISRQYKISLFMIGINNKVNIIIYSYGRQKAKEIISTQ